LEHILTPLRKLIQFNRQAREFLTSALTEQPLIQRIQGEPGTEDMVRKIIESMMRYGQAPLLDIHTLTYVQKRKELECFQRSRQVVLAEL
jgi:hypothetical protein